MMRRNNTKLSLVKKWLPQILLRPNAAAAAVAFSFQTQSSWTSRCEHSWRTTTTTTTPTPISSYHQPRTSSLFHPPGGLLISHPSTSTASTTSTLTSRLFSTHEKTTQEIILNDDEKDPLLDPYDILRELPTNKKHATQSTTLPNIPLPTHLSPTSLETFHKCPQAFFFLYILKLTRDPPMTPQLARGIICHTALEEVFELNPIDRSLVNLENLFRREWGRLRGNRGEGGDEDENALVVVGDDKNKKGNTKEKDGYATLFRDDDDATSTLSSSSYNVNAEIEWGQSSLELLRNYYELEDPKTVTNPNPLMREMWVQARFSSDDYNDGDEFVVRGKIDRIDIIQPSTTDDKLHLDIIDYKTGKKPHFKYSPKVNERIASEQFWKMKVYALILWKMIHQTDEMSGETKKADSRFGMSRMLQQRLKQALTAITNGMEKEETDWSSILELNSLRLMYFTSHLDDASANNNEYTMNATTDDDNNNDAGSRTIGKANYLDFSLGSSDPTEFQSILDETELEVQTIASDIKRLVNMQSPQAFEHCDWRYCSCHELRKKFKPGSVFQSPDLEF